MFSKNRKVRLTPSEWMSSRTVGNSPTAERGSTPNLPSVPRHFCSPIPTPTAYFFPHIYIKSDGMKNAHSGEKAKEEVEDEKAKIYSSKR